MRTAVLIALGLLASAPQNQPGSKSAPPRAPGTAEIPFVPPPPPLPPIDRQRGVALGLFAEDVSFSYGPLLAEIVAVGATHVALVVPLYQTDATSHDIGLHTRFSPTLAALAEVVRAAKRDGLQVMVFPIIRLSSPGPGQWRGTLAPRDRDAWFKRYGELMGELGAVAGVTGATRLVVGSELSSLEDDLDHWRPLVERMRAIFSGKLVYSANWDHYRSTGLFDLVDEEGISGYFNLRDASRRGRRRGAGGGLAAGPARDRSLAHRTHPPLHLHRARLPIAQGCHRGAMGRRSGGRARPRRTAPRVRGVPARVGDGGCAGRRLHLELVRLRRPRDDQLHAARQTGRARSAIAARGALAPPHPPPAPAPASRPTSRPTASRPSRPREPATARRARRRSVATDLPLGLRSVTREPQTVHARRSTCFPDPDAQPIRSDQIGPVRIGSDRIRSDRIRSDRIRSDPIRIRSGKNGATEGVNRPRFTPGVAQTRAWQRHHRGPGVDGARNEGERSRERRSGRTAGEPKLVPGAHSRRDQRPEPRERRHRHRQIHRPQLADAVAARRDDHRNRAAAALRQRSPAAVRR